MSKLKIVAVVCTLLVSSGANAQNEKTSSKFSHKGIKAAAALGSLGVNSSEGLDNGQSVALNLGYGFSNRSTLWLTLTAAEHTDPALNDAITEFDGLELSFQYKFMPQSRVQPFARIGVGAYQLRKKGSNLAQEGGGINVAVGADYFFTRHIGLGAEFNFKDIQYRKQRVSLSGDDLVTDLRPEINRDSKGFMVTLILQ